MYKIRDLNQANELNLKNPDRNAVSLGKAGKLILQNSSIKPKSVEQENLDFNNRGNEDYKWEESESESDIVIIENKKTRAIKKIVLINLILLIFIIFLINFINFFKFSLLIFSIRRKALSRNGGK